MPALATPPRVRSVDPTAYTPFSTFSCGGSTDHEDEVDLLVGWLHAGKFDPAVVRVTEDPETDGLVGFCVVERRPFRTDPDTAYIALIGVSADWRGTRLPDGGRLGAFILGDALNQIKALWHGPPMPTTWARVARDNSASHRIFADWGYELIPGPPDGYDTRYRPTGIGLTQSPGP
jgi:hypothetical protein